MVKKEDKKFKAVTDLGINFSKISKIPQSNQRTFISEQQVNRKPINNTNKMWLMSVWERRKELDPEGFDPDNWFNSSYWLDNPQRNAKIDDFWTGKSIQESKNKTADNFWIRKSMWEK